MNVVQRYRWRLARIIAPVAIIRDPDMDKAIMLRESHGPIAWIAIKSLDLNVTTSIEQREFVSERRYVPHTRDGKFSGTL